MGRRSKGEGTIRRRSDGKWEARYPVGQGDDGKTRYKYHYADTRQAAAQWIGEHIAASRAGTLADDRRLTVTQYLELWLDEIVRRQRAPRTYASYHDMCRLHIVPTLGAIRLEKLTALRVQTWVNALADSELSPRTVHYAHAILRAALSRAVRLGYIGQNVAKGTALPQARKYEARALTVEEAERLLAVAAGHRLEALYRVALGLGLRRGEVLALRWADVDLNRGTLRVVDSKSAAGRRTLPVPDQLVEALRAHWQRQAEERVAAERRAAGRVDAEGNPVVYWREHGLVFPSDEGTPITPRNLLRHFKGLITKANDAEAAAAAREGRRPRPALPDALRFHDLRHSCGSFLAAQGVPLLVVRDILGHATIGITADTYGHTYDEDKRAAVESIQRGKTSSGR